MEERAHNKLREQIHAGLDDLEAGRATTLDGAGLKSLFEDIKTRGREKLAREVPAETPQTFPKADERS
jgi:hypothetical protein